LRGEADIVEGEITRDDAAPAAGAKFNRHGRRHWSNGVVGVEMSVLHYSITPALQHPKFSTFPIKCLFLHGVDVTANKIARNEIIEAEDPCSGIPGAKTSVSIAL